MTMARLGVSPRIALAALALASVGAIGGALYVAAGRVALPQIAKGKGEACVEETAFMRRNHMTLLLHQRDETVLRGIRTPKYSLKECLACHAVLGPDAQPVAYDSPRNFCQSCHSYAAVKIDCFECHNARPAAGGTLAMRALR